MKTRRAVRSVGKRIDILGNGKRGGSTVRTRMRCLVASGLWARRARVGRGARSKPSARARAPYN